MGLEISQVVHIAHGMLWMAFLLAIPVLMTALVIGVAISLLQTVTSVQEMTLTFVPKLMAVMTTLALALPWMINQMSAYTHRLWAMLSSTAGM